MSSIMRARSGLMGRGEPSEVMGALPSRRLLDLRCSGSDALTVTPYCLLRPKRTDRHACPPARAGSFSGASRPLLRIPTNVSLLSRKPALSLDGRNHFSCPKGDLHLAYGRKERGGFGQARADPGP